jgi:hypothetical protein
VKVFLDGKSPNLYKPPQSHGSLMNLISMSSGSHSISSKIGGLSSGERFSPLDKAIPKSNLKPSTPNSLAQHFKDSIISFLTNPLFAAIVFPHPETS